jgi:hypothetical protein
MNGTNFKQKTSNIFCCYNCNYKTNRKFNYNIHIITAKHIAEINGNENKQKTSKKNICEFCNKQYQNSSGLWKHKKVCNKINYDNENETTDKDLIKMLIKENNNLKQMMIEENIELKQLIIEVLNNGTHNINNSNNNTMNSNNKTFNLQFFLNEQCKDALNISDFVNSIQLQVKDLEETGKLGYVDGISKVVITNLNQLDTNKRPIHCSDLKREVLYIKDNNEWIKDNENKDKMKNAIKHVANKNIKQI